MKVFPKAPGKHVFSPTWILGSVLLHLYGPTGYSGVWRRSTCANFPFVPPVWIPVPIFCQGLETGCQLCRFISQIIYRTCHSVQPYPQSGPRHFLNWPFHFQESVALTKACSPSQPDEFFMWLFIFFQFTL